MSRSRIAAAEFSPHWQNPIAMHVERANFEKHKFWRDFIAGMLAEKLAGLSVAVWGLAG